MKLTRDQLAKMMLLFPGEEEEVYHNIASIGDSIEEVIEDLEWATSPKEDTAESRIGNEIAKQLDEMIYRGGDKR